MTLKSAEQLIDVVQQARQVVEALPTRPPNRNEPACRYERAIRFYIQSSQAEKVAIDNGLYYASFYGFESVVQTLLDHGASVEYRSPTGATPLMKAVGSRNPGCVKILLDSKANPEALTNGGISAIQIAETLKETDMLNLFKSSRGA